MTILSTLLLVHAMSHASAAEPAASAGTVLKVAVLGSFDDGGGTLLTLNHGSDDGVELHDRGWVLDGSAVATPFAIASVTKDGSQAWVPLTNSDVKRLKHVRIRLTPGQDPPRLDRAKLGAGALGSCSTGYEMYKSGVINTWTEGTRGEVTALWLGNLGWKHRVCLDSTGMIYLGDATDAFVAAGGRNIRLQVESVGYDTAKVVVVQGKLTASMLVGNRRVVFRAKK